MIARDAGRSDTPNLLVHYILGEETAELIVMNMGGLTEEDLVAEFNVFRALRPDVEGTIVHVFLSAAPGERPTVDQWRKIADRTLDKAGYEGCPRVGSVHHESEGGIEHAHFAVCRVKANGSLAYGRNSGKRLTAAAAEVEQMPGLGIGPIVRRKPEEVKPKIEGRTLARAEMKVSILAATEGRPSMALFIDRLAGVGVAAKPNIADTGKFSGFLFERSGHEARGSGLGYKFAATALARKIVTDDIAANLELLATLNPPSDPVGPSPGGILHAADPSDLGELEAALPPYLRGLGSGLLVDLAHIGKRDPKITGFHQTKLNQYARLMGMAPAVEAPELKRPYVPRLAIEVDAEVVTLARDPNPPLRPAPPNRSVHQSRQRVAPPEGQLIHEHQGRWVVQTTSKVMFSDSGVNDVALQIGFEAAAASFGSYLSLRNFDVDMRERAVAVIARTRSLSLVKLDRPEDQARLTEAREREAEVRVEAARAAAEVAKNKSERARREEAERTPALENDTRTRLEAIAAAEEEAERLKRGRAPWEEAAAQFEAIREQVNSEKMDIEQIGTVLAADASRAARAASATDAGHLPAASAAAPPTIAQEAVPSDPAQQSVRTTPTQSPGAIVSAESLPNPPPLLRPKIAFNPTLPFFRVDDESFMLADLGETPSEQVKGLNRHATEVGMEVDAFVAKYGGTALQVKWPALKQRAEGDAISAGARKPDEHAIKREQRDLDGAAAQLASIPSAASDRSPTERPTLAVSTSATQPDRSQPEAESPTHAQPTPPAKTRRPGR